MVKETLLTEEGLKKLQEELEYAKSVTRMEIAERIKIAIAQGDISENAEYDEAKAAQGFNEGLIQELENKISTAKIIDIKTKKSVVNIGNRVKLLDIEMNEELDYTIVGSTEADPFQNKISNESPVGAAIIGRKKGEVVDVLTPGGTIQYKVVSIK